jgi:hypothetical protein
MIVDFPTAPGSLGGGGKTGERRVTASGEAGAGALADGARCMSPLCESAWLEHAEHYVETVIDRFRLPPQNAHIVELASNDGLRELATYAAFAERVKATKRGLLDFLIDAKRAGKTIAGYGAPGKGNTLLNYCGIRGDFLDFTVDRNPHKHGKFLPGTHIPISPPERIGEARPDYLLILPWNLQDEIMLQMAFIRDWGGQFVVPIPEVKVFA